MPASQQLLVPSARASLSTLLAATAVAALALSATPAWPQAAGQGATTSGPSSRTAPGALNPNLNPGTRPVVAASDREMMEDLAHANFAEIETGRLALEKSSNEKVRQFAQKMIDDHTSALRELQQLAQRKAVQLPGETDFQHKALAVALRLLPGETFDNQYIKQVGVNDHRRTVDLLEKIQRTAQDSDLKAHASKALPAVQRHLAMARDMAGQAESARGGTDPRAMGAGAQPSK